MNNPLKYVDPTGEKADHFYYDETGELIKRVAYEGADRAYDAKLLPNGTMQVDGENFEKSKELQAAQMEDIIGGEDQSGGSWDPVTDRRIGQLDSRVQGAATNFINQVESELGVQLRVTQGLRTNAEQNALYAKGRTAPGNIVTNAQGGESYHNYGLAIDVVVMQNGQPVWENLPSNIGNIGIQNGFGWGGNWNSFKDYPHFQMTFGQSINQLLGH